MALFASVAVFCFCFFFFLVWILLGNSCFHLLRRVTQTQRYANLTLRSWHLRTERVRDCFNSTRRCVATLQVCIQTSSALPFPRTSGVTHSGVWTIWTKSDRNQSDGDGNHFLFVCCVVVVGGVFYFILFYLFRYLFILFYLFIFIFAATLLECGCLSITSAHLVVVLVALLHRWATGAIVFEGRLQSRKKFCYVTWLVQWLPGLLVA